MNPYEILGVSPGASDEDIRAAYMALVKKYHPDRYQDSALKKQAEDKMKQINAAYDLLTKKAGGADQSGSSYSYGSAGSAGSAYGSAYSSYGSGYSGRQSYYSGQYAAEFSRVRSFINRGEIAAALSLLNSVPVRNAEWCFLYGMCCYRNGQYARAYEYISRACTMDPANAEYSSAMSSMRGAYDTTRTWTSAGNDLSSCGICSSILCANLLCSCCCRR
ncbi:MAG: DnaJ domain-containing protein [Clostridia bacterium]|nr:DnaJ domain-containing protein [Clostridia bacterium]